jgi:hypothetical protein
MADTQADTPPKDKSHSTGQSNGITAILSLRPCACQSAVVPTRSIPTITPRCPPTWQPSGRNVFGTTTRRADSTYSAPADSTYSAHNGMT